MHMNTGNKQTNQTHMKKWKEREERKPSEKPHTAHYSLTHWLDTHTHTHTHTNMSVVQPQSMCFARICPNCAQLSLIWVCPFIHNTTNTRTHPHIHIHIHVHTFAHSLPPRANKHVIAGGPILFQKQMEH
jgi:hypothetical protein